MRYEIKLVPEDANPHPENENVDVEVVFDSGETYAATFFTLENIRQLFQKNNRTGECLAGTYFWSTGMIIVERLTEQVIADTIEDLLAIGEFEKVFEGPFHNQG